MAAPRGVVSLRGEPAALTMGELGRKKKAPLP
jgi:hypothetical protein